MMVKLVLTISRDERKLAQTVRTLSYHQKKKLQQAFPHHTESNLSLDPLFCYI